MAKKQGTGKELEKWLTEMELAEVTRLTPRFIKDARLKHGLPYFKLGRLVRVKLSDFILWSEQRKVG